MTNLKKSYSVSALAIIALAFCVLLVSQAVMAAKDKRLNDAVVTQSAEDMVPLPTVDLLGSRTALKAVSDPDETVMLNQIDPSELGKSAPKGSKALETRTVRTAVSLGGGDAPADATEIAALPYSDPGVLGAVTDDYPLDCGFGDPGDGDLFYKYTPAVNESVTISLCNSDNPLKDFILGLWAGDPSAGGTMVTCDEDLCVAPGWGASRIDNFMLTGGTTYYIQIKGWGVGDGAYVLDVYDPYASADFVEAEICGDHNTDGCYFGGLYANATNMGALVPGSSYSLAGQTYLNALPRSFGPGGTADADQWRFTLTGTGKLTYTFFAEVQMGIFLHWYPTPGVCTGQTLVPGTNWAIPANTPYTISVVVFPGTQYGFSLRAADQIMTCTGGPTGGAPRYLIDMSIEDITPIDDCGLATAVNGPATPSPTVSTYTQSLAGMSTDGPIFPGYGGWGYEQNVWWRFRAMGTGTYTFTTCNTASCEVEPGVFDTPDLMLGVYPDGCPPHDGDQLLADDDGCMTGPGGPWTSAGEAILIGGQYYLVTVGVWPWSGCADPTVVLDVSYEPLVPLNDLCANAQNLGTGPGHYFVHNLDATWEGPQGSWCATGGLCGDVWYTWTATTSGRVTFDMCRGAQPMIFDNTLEVYRGSECLTTNPRDPDEFGCSDDGCGRFSSGALLEIDCSPGEEFLVRMTGWFGGPPAPCSPGGVGFGYMDVYETPNGFRPANDACIDAGAPMVLTSGVPVTFSGDLTNSSWDNCPLAYDQTLGPFQFQWNTFHAIEVSNCSRVTIDFCGMTEVGYTRITSGGEPGEYQLFGGCPCEGDYVRFRATSWSQSACTSYPADGNDNNTWYFDGLIPGAYIVEVSAYCLGTNVAGALPLYTRPYSGHIMAEDVECVYCAASANSGYCPPTANGSWMSDVSFADMVKDVNDNPADNIGSSYTPNDCHGYEDNSAMIAHVYKGMAYDLSVRMRKLTGGTTGYRNMLTDDDSCVAYIDWNQNSGLAASTSELGERYALPGTEYVYNRLLSIEIPMDAKVVGEGPTGYTKLRIRVSVGLDGASSACGLIPTGEVEDYVLEVKELECGDFGVINGLGAEDIMFLQAWYFGHGPAPDFWFRGDIDGDGNIDIADIIALADAVYRSGELNCDLNLM